MELASLSTTGDEPVPVLAVSADSAEDSSRLLANLPGGADTSALRLLEDVEHRVIDRYGLLNTEMWTPVPHPATFVIDNEGRVRWSFVEVNYRVRASTEEVRAALAEAVP